jgi:alanyl-tRNA synthetase
VLLAASKDSGINAGQVLKEALAKAGGRGGGSPAMAQGSLNTIEDFKLFE